jgi:hypothetical protein
MILPYEIVLQIVTFLETTDKINCLTVCKAWYRPTLESVYCNVRFKSLRKLRKFIDMIAHHPLTPGIYVKRLRLVNTTTTRSSRGRPMIFTEFELLTRYCINLTELYFNEPWYWYCLLQLDWSCTWLNLRKLPPVNSLEYITRTLYPTLADRLTEFHVQRRPEFDVMIQLLSTMPKLQSIVLGGTTWNLTTNELQKIHTAAPRARRLKAMFRLPPSTDDQQLLICKHNSFLDHLHCHIDHPLSGWFSIIQTMYYNVQTLVLQLVERDGHIGQESFSTIASFEPTLNLIKHINVQQLEISLRSYALNKYVEDMILSIVYEYNLKDPTIISTVSFVLDYFDEQPCYYGSSNRFNKQKSFKSISTRSFSKSKHGIQTHVHHAFALNFDISEELDYNEFSAIKGFITHPIHLSVTRLTMTREITYCTKKNYVLYFDSLLTYFQNLESLSLDCIIDRTQFKAMEHQTKYMQLSVSSTMDQHTYPSFRSLTVRSIKINRSLYQYLFSKCPNISILKITDCKLDEETTLVLEYLCLQHDVLLCIKQ